jgi:peptide/nickel transport system substrate-binding protein
MTKRIKLAAMLAVVVLFAAACGNNNGSSDQGSQQLKRGGTLQLALVSDVFSAFDPQKAYYSVEWEFQRCCLIRTLLSYNGESAAQGGNTLRPDLAASLPEISKDGMTYTFHLKDGIKFGPPYDSPITSQDFVNGFLREANPQGSAGGYSYYYSDTIKGFSDVYAGKAKSISGITTPDDKTIVFQLLKPSPDFPYLLAMPAASPIPTGADVGHEKDYGQYLVATGPYMFQGSEDMNFKLPPNKQKPVAGNDPGRSYVLVRNPDYDPSTDDLRPSYVDQINIQVGGTESDLQNKVDAGDLDMCFDCLGLPTSALQKYETTPDLKDQLHIFQNDGISYGTFNLGIAPFDDVHIRKAFNWIYPLNSTRQLGGGPPQGTFAGHWIPNGLENNILQSYNPFATPDNNGDLAKAQAEIKLSKYDKNGDGSCDESPECHDILTIANSSGTAPKSVALLQQALKPLGITLDPKFLDTGAMYAKCYTLASKAGYCASVSWGKDYADADTFGPLFVASGIGCCNYSNLGASSADLQKAGYSITSVPSVDKQFNACLPKTGQDRFQCWADFDKTLTEDVVPGVVRLATNNIDITGSRILGYSFDQFAGQMAVDHVALSNASST